jgi:hypothetical protein
MPNITEPYVIGETIVERSADLAGLARGPRAATFSFGKDGIVL